MEIPNSLFKDADGEREQAARLGRFVLLEELGYFGEATNVALARGEYEGSFVAAVRRRFSNIYGDTRGCDPADIEIAAEMLDVFDLVYETPIETPET